MFFLKRPPTFPLLIGGAFVSDGVSDGVADGVLHGVRDAKQTHHYYKLGYDFGLTISERQRQRLEEV